MSNATHSSANTDRPSTADMAKLARERERQELVVACAVLADRKDALEQLLDEKKTRLQVLMNEDGYEQYEQAEGSADFESKWTCKVTDPEKLAARFPPAILAEFVRPTKAFVKAAEKAGVVLSDCVQESSSDPSLVFRRPQTKIAKEFRERAIEQTKAEASNTVARIVAAIMKSKR